MISACLVHEWAQEGTTRLVLLICDGRGSCSLSPSPNFTNWVTSWIVKWCLLSTWKRIYIDGMVGRPSTTCWLLAASLYGFVYFKLRYVYTLWCSFHFSFYISMDVIAQQKVWASLIFFLLLSVSYIFLSYTIRLATYLSNFWGFLIWYPTSLMLIPRLIESCIPLTTS